MAWLLGLSVAASFAGACGDGDGRGAAASAGAGGSHRQAGSSAPVAGSSGVSAGTQGSAGTAGAGTASEAGRAGGAGGAPSSAGAGGAQAGAGAGAGGAGGNAGSAGSAGSMPDGTDITAVCVGGTIGMDSDTARPDPLTVSREYAAVKVLAPGNELLSLKTTMQVPKTPSSRQTLFIWPGVQSKAGASDPAGIGNGVLQPVLTWGPSCAPRAPRDSYSAWWMAGMYVNVTTGAAGVTGCAGGDYMLTEVGDLLEIDMSVEGNAWTQTITDLRTMETVDFTIDLKAQVQNNAMWVIEVPSGETIRPAEDVVFTRSVLTFAAPVDSCQPSQAGTTDYFSAPLRSPDGLHCCFEKIILRAQR